MEIKWFKAGEWFHIATMINTFFLQTYLAYITYKLSQPTDMTFIVRQIKAANARNKHVKLKLSDYKYSVATGEELMQALNSQTELE